MSCLLPVPSINSEFFLNGRLGFIWRVLWTPGQIHTQSAHLQEWPMKNFPLLTSWVPASVSVMATTEKSPYRSPLASIDTCPAIPMEEVKNSALVTYGTSACQENKLMGFFKTNSCHRESHQSGSIFVGIWKDIVISSVSAFLNS